MPRYSGVLLSFTIVVLCLGINIVNYPAVKEMLKLEAASISQLTNETDDSDDETLFTAESGDDLDYSPSPFPPDSAAYSHNSRPYSPSGSHSGSSSEPTFGTSQNPPRREVLARETRSGGSVNNPTSSGLSSEESRGTPKTQIARSPSQGYGPIPAELLSTRRSTPKPVTPKTLSKNTDSATRKGSSDVDLVSSPTELYASDTPNSPDSGDLGETAAEKDVTAIAADDEDESFSDEDFMSEVSPRAAYTNEYKQYNKVDSNYSAGYYGAQHEKSGSPNKNGANLEPIQSGSEGLSPEEIVEAFRDSPLVLEAPY
ncbi:MAG: hypothetical protein ACRC2T_07460 [Thermoguttaceae bacterium]